MAFFGPDYQFINNPRVQSRSRPGVSLCIAIPLGNVNVKTFTAYWKIMAKDTPEIRGFNRPSPGACLLLFAFYDTPLACQWTFNLKPP